MSEKFNEALPKIEYVTVTPEMARQWLDERMFERQRDVRPGKVKLYTKLMKEGEWLNWSILQFSQNGSGAPVGTDGQHRLHAVVASEVPMKAIVVTYPNENTTERYIKTDKGAPRSALDTIVALGLPEKYDVAKSLLVKSWAAVLVIAEDFWMHSRQIGHPESVAVRMLEDEGYIEIAKKYAEAVGAQSYTGGFYRASTMAIGMYVMKYAPQKIEEHQIYDFWHGAAYDIGEEPSDPRRRLHDHVTKQSIYTPSKKREEAVSKAYGIRFTAKCWNYWIAQQPIKQRKVATSDRLVIEATPLGKSVKIESEKENNE